MAVNLSANARALLSKRTLQPNLIIEIDGVDNIYSALDIITLSYYGDAGLVYGMPGIFYGGGNAGVKPYISLGTSGNTISQQLLQDKGGTQSITNFSIDLIDKNQEITQLITPGVVVEELLGSRASIYINYNGGAHPEDSVLVHRGIISGIESQPASIKLTIDSPERSKHQDIFINQNTKLNGSITNSATTITVDSTDLFLLPADSGTIETYFQIGDEIIKYTGKTSTTFTGCARGSLGTTAVAHSDDDEVSSLYSLSGNAIDLALKIMLSNADSPYATDQVVSKFVTTGPMTTRPGAIAFDHYNIQDKLGLVVGDTITTTGATNPANNLTDEPITAFGTNEYGSWIEVNQVLVVENTTSALASFKSKYNVLTDGLGMTPIDVDVARHEQLKTRFNSSIPTYSFYFKDTIKGNDFLNTQIYYPAGFYSLPRKTKASVGITTPPIADSELVFLDETNVVSPGSLKSNRSTNKNFYNSIIFRYEKDVIDDKYLAGKINFSADSQSRIKNIGNKPLTITSDGLRDNGATDVLVAANSRRILDRYQFAAESFPGVKVFGKTGVAIEVGDIVAFGSADLKMSDTSTGNRDSSPKLYEVVNKSLNVKTQEVTVDLLSTNFSLDARYGVVGPSSYVGSGSTTSSIKIIDSFSTVAPIQEKVKYSDYIGQPIKVHSPDWTYNEESILIGFDPTDDYRMLVDPPLTSAPLAGYIVDGPTYDITDVNIGNKWKLINCSFTPQVQIVSGTSQTVFDVSIGDASKFTVSQPVRVHNYDFSVDSVERKVVSIVGTTITVDDALGFVPSSSEYVDLIGFPDGTNGSAPYRLI